MDGPIDMGRKGEFMGSCTHYVTLNYGFVRQGKFFN